MLSSLRATFASLLAADLPASYPDYLALSEPRRDRPRRAIGLLLLLVIATFIPRAVMAWKIDTICADGVWYFRVASELEQRQLDPYDGGRLQLGTYPFALASLHRLGLDWENAAEFYGVLVSTLAVLPLFGWVRRQFDDRVAVVACLLYAAHPKLVEWSPEAIREPSFWLFFLVALYCLWRATTEVDWRLFIAGGAATALACLTRFEGWFLLFPMWGWSLLRFWRLHTGRWRLAGGLALCGCAIPAVFVAFGALMPVGADWRTVRTEPIERAGVWLRSWGGEADTSSIEANAPIAANQAQAPAAATIAADAQQASATTIAPPVAAAAATSWTVLDTLWMFLRTIERGLTPLFAIFMFGGYFSRFRLFNRSDHVPVLLVALAVCAGIWIHLWYAHLASSRYVLTIALLATRSAAVGLLDFAHFVGAQLARRIPRGQLVASGGLLAVVLLVGIVDALSSDFRSRETLAGLGQWIRNAYGESTTVVGSESQLALVGYYAHATAVQFPHGMARGELVDWIAHVKPDVVIISTRAQPAADYQPLLDESQRLGLALVASERMPGGAKHMLVLTRTQTPSAPIHQATRVPSPVP